MNAFPAICSVTEKRCVYVSRSDAQPERYYTGLTSNVAARLATHNAGGCLHTVTVGDRIDMRADQDRWQGGIQTVDPRQHVPGRVDSWRQPRLPKEVSVNARPLESASE